MRLLGLLSLLVMLSVTPVMAQETVAKSKVIEKLQDTSVTIKAGQGQGSGSLVTRKVGDETFTYVWTAAHVVDSLRKIRTVVDPTTGGNRTIVEFEPAGLVQEYKQDGRTVGEIKMEARVIRFSDADTGEDLALLEVRKRNFVGDNVTTRFYLDDEIPQLGSKLLHVGSLKGQFGCNSLTTGIISQIGRVLDLNAEGVVFDQTTVTAFPGSSGGGVYLETDGRYIGMLVRGAGESFNFIVPARRMRAWAKKANVEWALDPSVPMPTLEELQKMPVEDVGLPASMTPQPVADQSNAAK